MASAVDAPPYRYVRFTIANPNQIRLFRLEPAQPGSDYISGTLDIYDLRQWPTYECLSYAWGTADKNASIFIENCQLKITESLLLALASLRLPHASRKLWIDQICIHQNSIGERNHQIRLMGRIYQQAERDLLWLGPTSTSNSVAFKWIQNTYNDWESALRKDRTIPELGYSANLQHAMDLSPPSLEQRLALEETFQKCPAWHRMWIVQEVIFAQDVLLVSGHQAVPLTVIDSILKLVLHNPDWNRSPMSDAVRDMFKQVIPMLQARTEIQRGNRPTLSQLLHDFQEWDATDPKDHVYSLVGLASTPGLVPNYTKTVVEVFTDATVAVIVESTSLDAICFDQDESFSHDEFKLPTWVPNYALHHGQVGAVRARATWPNIFAAGRGCTSTKMLLSQDHTLLEIQGLSIDYLDRVFEVNGEDSVNWHSQVFKLIPQFSDHNGLSNVSSSEHDATISTLILGQMDPSNRATNLSILRPDFIHWCHFNAMATSESTKQPPIPPSRFLQALERHRLSRPRRMFAITKNHRYLTSVHAGAEPGDEICVLPSASIPLVVRPIETNQHGMTCARIGTAYVYGIMDGEAWDHPDRYPQRLYTMV